MEKNLFALGINTVHYRLRGEWPITNIKKVPFIELWNHWQEIKSQLSSQELEKMLGLIVRSFGFDD